MLKLHSRRLFTVVCAGVLLVASAHLASAAAVRGEAGFGINTLTANDDGSTGQVNIGFTANFFGTSHSQLYVNNNGNVTFDDALGEFTPFNLLSTSTVIIAPFFADVDTTSAGDPVTYGTDTVNGRAAFGVNWINVDYFASSLTHTSRNSFQLILIDRSDIAAGDFDIEFNYDQIEWETGEASGGDQNGLGGDSARVGYSNGVDTALELPGSAVDGAFLDNGPVGTALIHNRLNSDVDGRYVFSVRNGVVQPAVPEPSTLGLVGVGAVALFALRWHRRRV